MNLVKFLEKLFKEDGIILIDANSKKYIIGKSKKDAQQNAAKKLLNDIKLDLWTGKMKVIYYLKGNLEKMQTL